MANGSAKNVEKYLRTTNHNQETRNINIKLPAQQMEVLKDNGINISAVMRDAVAKVAKNFL